MARLSMPLRYTRVLRLYPIFQTQGTILSKKVFMFDRRCPVYFTVVHTCLDRSDTHCLSMSHATSSEHQLLGRQWIQ